MCQRVVGNLGNLQEFVSVDTATTILVELHEPLLQTNEFCLGDWRAAHSVVDSLWDPGEQRGRFCRARQIGRQRIEDTAMRMWEVKHLRFRRSSSSPKRTVGVLLQVVDNLGSCLTHRDLRSIVRFV
jgi:hypothetical protein